MYLLRRGDPPGLRVFLLDFESHLCIYVTPYHLLTALGGRHQSVRLPYRLQVLVLELDVQPRLPLGVHLFERLNQFFERVKLLGVCLLDPIEGCVTGLRVQKEGDVDLLGFYRRQVLK